MGLNALPQSGQVWVLAIGSSMLLAVTSHDNAAHIALPGGSAKVPRVN